MRGQDSTFKQPSSFFMEHLCWNLVAARVPITMIWFGHDKLIVKLLNYASKFKYMSPFESCGL